MRFCLFKASKGFETVLAPLIAAGAAVHGDIVETRDLEEFERPLFDGTIVVGIVRREVLWGHIPAKKPALLYIDKGLTRERAEFQGQNLPKFWRFCVGDVHATRYLRHLRSPHDRLAASGLLPLHERTESRDGPIVIAGSSAKFHQTMRLPNPTEWAADIIRQIMDSGDKRMVIYRPKPSWRDAEPIDGAEFHHGEKTSIDSSLKDASLVITYGSIASVDAIKAGIPCVVLGNAPARDVSSTSLTKGLKSPVWASREDREQWAANLSYCQWRPSELQDGTAWASIKETMDAIRSI